MNDFEDKNLELNENELEQVSGGSNSNTEKKCSRCGGMMYWKQGSRYLLCDNCGKMDPI